MRKLVFFLILFGSLSAQAHNIAWSGPHALKMDRSPQVIDSYLANRLGSVSAEATLPVLVFFTDKGIANQSAYNLALEQAETALTPAARHQRLKVRSQDELVDFQDLPVYAPYVNEVLATGATLRQTLKWFNAISVNVTKAQASAISRLPYTRLMKLVAGFQADIDIPPSPATPTDEIATTLNYGPSATQLTQINVISAHELGFKGQGVIVCMMDVGYRQTHLAFQNIINSGRLLAQYDFINHDNNTDFDPEQDCEGQASHGTVTWSTLGGESSTHIYGPSYLANFILAKTENYCSERHIEEDNWAAGAQWADSIGASVISSSLGYRYFDSGEGDYQYSDLNGHTAIVTLAALQAARNGIMVCNAMGNDGGDGVGSLIAPADADSILSCGAVDNTGYLTGFSSLGPTFDGRVKPEVCAMGQGTVCADPNDMNAFTTSSGTSLSTPLVGGSSGVLFSAHPNWTNMMVREALMNTATKTDSISSAYGWGLMDVGRALYYHPQGDIIINHRPMINANVNTPIDFSLNASGGHGVTSAFLYWRNGTAGSFTELAMSGDSTSFTAQIPGQTGSVVQYYFKAVDAESLYAFNPLGGENHPFSLGLGATQFTDNFDDGPLYWKTGGVKNSWGINTKYAHSGFISMTDSPTEDYKNGVDSWMESNFPIDLSRVTAAGVSFYWRGVLQTGHDTLHLEISIDGGNNWNRLRSLNGSVFAFTQVTADLGMYIGNNNVKIRFHFTSDATGRREGAYVDDVMLVWTPTGINDQPGITPIAFTLGQNYPNPFNPSTTISFSLPTKGEARLNVFDLLGRHVKMLVFGELPAGAHKVIWDGRDEAGHDVASGIYMYKLTASGASDVRRMTLVR